MEELEASSFGDLLRRERTERGWTQEDLAARAGLSVEAIGTLERGSRQRPRRATVRLLARALDLSRADELFFEAVARQAIHEPRHERPTVPVDGTTDAESHTFLVAEIRGYERFGSGQGSTSAARLAAKFALLIASAAAERGGTVLEVRESEAMALFPSSRHGLLAAADLQSHFSQMPFADAAMQVSLGIGVETGIAPVVERRHQGPAVRVATRLCRLAGPNETLTTDRVSRLARSVGDLEYSTRGFSQLSGISDTGLIVEVRRSGVTPSAERIGGDGVRPVQLPVGSFLGALPPGTFVGRAREVRHVLTLLDVVAGGSGQLALLSGEAGVGKTRLAQEIALQVRNHGFLVATARCYEPQQTTAFYPFIDALATLFSALPASLRAEVGKRWPYLGQLLPDQVGMYPMGGAGSDDQQRLFHAVTGFLQEATDRQPVALLLDDLHWADSSSLALLQHVARETSGDRMFLFGTYRNAEIGTGHPLKNMLRDLNREGLATKIEVRQLEVEETSALIAALMGVESVSKEFTHLIHHRTDGNPYFVEQVIRAMVERGDIFWRDGEWDRKELEQIDVPDSIRAVVAQRLTRLSGETQVVLREASALGETFHFDDLQSMGRRSEQEVDDALEEASLAGLIRVMRDDFYMFDHALTHQTLYDELSPRRKRNLHRTIGAMLEGLPSGLLERRAPELAHHFSRGYDQSRALIWTIRAGDTAEAMFAHDDAALQYSRAVQLARDLEDSRGQAEAMERLGRAYRHSARYSEALETLEAAVAVYRALGEPYGEARTVGQIGRVCFDAGLTDEGIRRIKPVLDNLEQPDGDDFDRVHAELDIILAHLLWRGGTYVESARMAEMGADRARRIGDTGLLAEAEFRRGMALSNSGDFRQGFQVMEGAVTLAEAAGDLDTACRAVGNLALVHWDRGETGMARALMEKSLELCRKTNDPTTIADKLGDLAVADFTQGAWESARTLLDDADRVLRGASTSWVKVHTTLRRGELDLAQGRLAAGLRLVETGREMAERNGDILAECEAAYVLSEEALFSGEPAQARSHLERFLGRHAVGRADRQALQTWGLALFARLFAELGDVKRAEDYLSRVSNEQLIAHLDTVHSVRAVVAACANRWDEAELHAEEALTFARRTKCLVSEARLLYFWGRWLKGKGEDQRACGLLREARDLFRHLGAAPYVERVERMLAEDPAGRTRG